MREGDPPEPMENSGDIMAGDRRLSRPDASLPDWEVPDSSYRPIPIVWFAAAFLIQMVTLWIAFLVLLSAHPLFFVAAGVLITAWIGKWTWDRGMAQASSAWRTATMVTLVVQFALYCGAASLRM